MTTPIGPPDFPLSKDWWLSGSYWRTKSAQDVWAVLKVEAAPADERKAAVKAYYDEHPDRLAFVPDNLMKALGLARDRSHDVPRRGDHLMTPTRSSKRDRLVAALLPIPAPEAFQRLSTFQRRRVALYVVVAVLAGVDPERAWVLGLSEGKDAEDALTETDTRVTSDVLERMAISGRYSVPLTDRPH